MALKTKEAARCFFASTSGSGFIENEN